MWRDSEEIPLMVAEHYIYLVHTYWIRERRKILASLLSFCFPGY
jgi:hypothetical protein